MGPSVELPSERVGFVLRESGQIGAFQELLPTQAIGDLTDPTLPRAVGISEIDA